MPIPNLEADGVLPIGVHACSLEEVCERFGRFQRTSVRQELTRQLLAYVSEARSTGLVAWLAIDGSYVTDRDEPGDIDLVVVQRAEQDFHGELPPFSYNVISRRRVKQKYNFDILVAPEDSPVLTLRHPLI